MTRGGSTSEAMLPPAPPAQVPNPPQQPPPRTVPFARMPSQATIGVIDYNTRMGERLYQTATEKLDEDRYDGSAVGLFPVPGLIKERARKFGWDNSIMMIPNPSGGPNRYIPDHYGTATLAERRAHEATYIAQPTRNAQDTYILYECIMNSLLPEAKAKISICRDDFWINRYTSGNLFLKVVIRECHLDTNATVASIRQRLASLDTYLPTIDYDIGKLNMYVKTLMDQLTARGETSTDLLSNLFTRYLAAKDIPGC